jgi:molecular chaperone Hsp33
VSHPVEEPGADNLVLPFRTETSGISGRLVRLGSVVDEILQRHNYPEPVSEVLGEALALTGMLGSQLKFDGKLIVQTRSDGPLGFFVTNFQSPGGLRGYASFDAAGIEAITKAGEASDHGALLGSGHLALTIDQGADMDRYQGIVPLTGEPLSQAALGYFRQSEQLPTWIKLAVARVRNPSGDNKWHWRAGGLMVQHVSPEGGKPPPEDAPQDFLMGDDDDDWQRVAMLAQTVELHELIDPTLAPERLIYRLFHEEGVRAFETVPLEGYCQCSADRVEALIATFDAEERESMKTPDGQIGVTCEFCGRFYNFTGGG